MITAFGRWLFPAKDIKEQSGLLCDWILTVRSLFVCMFFNAKTPRRKDAKNCWIGLPPQPDTKRQLGFPEIALGSDLCAFALKLAPDRTKRD